MLPFNGGTVEVQASLIALPGRDNLAPAIDVLQSVGNLVAPPLGQVLRLTDSLSAGIRTLLSGQAEPRLGLHQTLVSEGGGGTSIMRAGSLAVIRPSDKHQIAVHRLRVRNHQLHLIPQDASEMQPLKGVDYILLRIEGRAERDDWRLPDIDGPLKDALFSLDNGNHTAAAGYRALALAAAHRSPEIAEHDRRRVIERIKTTYSDAQKPGQGATGGERPDLTAAMRRAIPRARARAEGKVSEAELFR